MPRRRSLIVCALVPRFALRVAAGMGGSLPDEPVALGPEPGGPPLLGEANAAASAFGVQAGMRVAEGIARCPRLRLVTPDPGAVADASEMLLSRLEGLGAAVEPLAPGRALFSADGLVRLHGGANRLLAATAMAAGAGARVGAGPGRFVAQAAAVRSRPRRPHLVEEGAATSFLAPMPVGRLPLDPETVSTLEALGVRTAGELAALPLPAVADRFGRAGIAAWRLSQGEDDAYVAPRTPPEPLRERISFPEPAGDLLVLRGALAVLIDRLLAHPRRAGRPPRALVVSARLAAGGSFRRPVDPARADRRPAPAARRPPAPPDGAPGGGRRARARDLRAGSARRSPARAPAPRVRGPARARRGGRPPGPAGLGEGHLWRVVEVAPWSRLPEGRHLLVPFDG